MVRRTSRTRSTSTSSISTTRHTRPWASERDGTLAPEHGRSGRGELERRVVGDVLPQEAEVHQLADERGPLVLAQRCADAEDAQAVVPELAHALGRASAQDVHHMSDAEALADAVD